MKITTALMAGLLVSLLASGSAHAKVCSTPLGQVTGLLSLDPSISIVNTENVTCLEGSKAPFGWNNSSTLSPPDPELEEVFTTSANLTKTGIEITMYTGATGGFNSDLIWTLTLPSGSLFNSISLQSSDFEFDEESWTEGDTLSFSITPDKSSAEFKILAQGGTNPDNSEDFNSYAFATPFSGLFAIKVTQQPNEVPEPGALVTTLTCLGILGVVRRRTSNLRRNSEVAMSRTRASKVLS